MLDQLPRVLCRLTDPWPEQASPNLTLLAETNHRSTIRLANKFARLSERQVGLGSKLDGRESLPANQTLDQLGCKTTVCMAEFESLLAKMLARPTNGWPSNVIGN